MTNCGVDDDSDGCVVGGGGVDGVVESGTAASQRWRAFSTFSTATMCDQVMIQETQAVVLAVTIAERIVFHCYRRHRLRPSVIRSIFKSCFELHVHRIRGNKLEGSCQNMDSVFNSSLSLTRSRSCLSEHFAHAELAIDQTIDRRCDGRGEQTVDEREQPDQ